MLTTPQIHDLVQRQLALDVGCAPEVLSRGENIVFPFQALPGRRQYFEGPRFLELAIWDGHLFAGCAPELLGWAEGWLVKRAAAWLFQHKNLRQIDDALAPFGYHIVGSTRYFLPRLPLSPAPDLPGRRWYEGEALEQFRGDDRWKEALAFNAFCPDMVAVAALDPSGAPIAMAGASRDGERMWQIGIIVLPEHRGRGLAAGLTAQLRDELLRRDIVPFYGTAESHIVSQNVALSAGFRPAFGYLYAERIQPPSMPAGQ